MKKNETLPIQARESVAFPRDVPRADGKSHPSLLTGRKVSGWVDNRTITYSHLNLIKVELGCENNWLYKLKLA